jgi:hypothetical protein
MCAVPRSPEHCDYEDFEREGVVLLALPDSQSRHSHAHTLTRSHVQTFTTSLEVQVFISGIQRGLEQKKYTKG